MPKVKVYDMSGNVVEEIELDSNIFGVEIMSRQCTCGKKLSCKPVSGTYATKDRSEVNGGRKPYRQKGTGRARH